MKNIALVAVVVALLAFAGSTWAFDVTVNVGGQENPQGATYKIVDMKPMQEQGKKVASSSTTTDQGSEDLVAQKN